MKYAQINSDNICMGVSDLSGEIDSPNMVPLVEEEGENVVGWTWSGTTWINPPAPPEEQDFFTPQLYAAAQIRIDGEDISGLSMNARFAGAFRGDIGKYYVYFAETLPEVDYLAKAWDGLCRAYVMAEDQFADYFVVTVVDQAGVPSDPSSINIEITRNI